MAENLDATPAKKRSWPRGPKEKTLGMHSRNLALSKFLSERRGARSMSEMAKLAGPSYFRWEVNGRLPTSPHALKKLAEVLECDIEALTSLVPETVPRGGWDIMPLIRNLAACELKQLTRNELFTLLKLQGSFEEPLAPKLAEALVEQSRLQTEK